MHIGQRFLLLATLLLPATLCGQEATFTLSGYVVDAESGEQLLGATVWHPSSKSGTAANLYGHYSISLPAGEQEVLFSYLGYTPQKLRVMMEGDMKLDVELVSGLQLGTAVVESSSSDRIEEQVQVEVVSASVRATALVSQFVSWEIEKLPKQQAIDLAAHCQQNQDQIDLLFNERRQE